MGSQRTTTRRLLLYTLGVVALDIALAMRDVDRGANFITASGSWLPFAIAVTAWAVIAFWINIFVHEGGHWLAGRLLGFKLYAFQAGPFLWTWGEGGRRFQRSWYAGKLGGFVSMWPRDPSGLRWKFGLHVLAGPLASLVFGLATLPWYVAVTKEENWSRWHLGYELGVLLLCVYGLLLWFLNLIPRQAHGAVTDGGQIWSALQGGPAFKRMAAIGGLTSVARTGVRPRDYPEDLVTAATSYPDGSPQHAFSLLMRAYHEMDTGHDEEAVQAANEAADAVGKKASLIYAMISNEAAAIVAWFGAGRVRARELFDRVDRSLLAVKFASFRSEALVLMAEGRLDQADVALKQAETGLAKELEQHPNLFPMERDWMPAIRARLEQRKPAPSPLEGVGGEQASS